MLGCAPGPSVGLAAANPGRGSTGFAASSGGRDDPPVTAILQAQATLRGRQPQVSFPKQPHSQAGSTAQAKGALRWETVAPV